MSNFAFGLGVGTQSAAGDWLEVYFNAPLLNAADDLIKAVGDALGYEGGNQTIEIEESQLKALEAAFLSVGAEDQAEIVEVLEGTRQPLVVCILASDEEPQTTAEVYLKLSLLSHRLVKPHGINLTGMFGKLPNVAWTNEGAVALDELPKRQLAARAQGRVLDVHSVDKFPKMTNYVVPAGIRVGDAARIRLGAHVGEGTTVMHEGFINFNA
ncbi:MAG: 2,3,4,5-tetrahydropyridine-2,6-dicarboxylate N-succinyltransferase, partial [Oceanospirillaceae bacterium]|nr:2,3,4,5-tetrahydropyridine-2,6-dicarboxylate N-succinyltransferase [Oceanospirillaceae bacterium]